MFEGLCSGLECDVVGYLVFDVFLFVEELFDVVGVVVGDGVVIDFLEVGVEGLVEDFVV